MFWLKDSGENETASQLDRLVWEERASGESGTVVHDGGVEIMVVA